MFKKWSLLACLGQCFSLEAFAQEAEEESHVHSSSSSLSTQASSGPPDPEDPRVLLMIEDDVSTPFQLDESAADLGYQLEVAPSPEGLTPAERAMNARSHLEEDGTQYVLLVEHHEDRVEVKLIGREGKTMRVVISASPDRDSIVTACKELLVASRVNLTVEVDIDEGKEEEPNTVQPEPDWGYVNSLVRKRRNLSLRKYTAPIGLLVAGPAVFFAGFGVAVALPEESQGSTRAALVGFFAGTAISLVGISWLLGVAMRNFETVRESKRIESELKNLGVNIGFTPLVGISNDDNISFGLSAAGQF